MQFPIRSLAASVAVTVALSAATAATSQTAPQAAPVRDVVTSAATLPDSAVVVRHGEPDAAGTAVVDADGHAGHAPDDHVTAAETERAAAFDGSTIERLYRAYFRRPSEPGGYAYWVGVWTSGYPIESISNDFSKVPEFQARYGTVTDRRFVELVYSNVLDRTPDAGGYAYWTDRMARHGMTRGQLMINFSESTEFKAKTNIGARPLPVPDVPVTTVDPARYSFSYEGPVGWAPCRPVDVVVNRSGAPTNVNFDAALSSALAKLSSATGVTWRVVAGTPARPADPHRVDPPRNQVAVFYATAWPAGDGALGYGYSGYSWTGSEQPYIDRGAVVLRPSWVPANQSQLESLLMHEFGHVAGITHVGFTDEIMYPVVQGRTTWGIGDRYALGKVTRAGTRC